MIFQDVVNGRGLALKASSISDISALRVSPLGAVEARKLRVIYVLTFAGDGYGCKSEQRYRFSTAPPCELRPVFGEVCRQIVYLQNHHDAESRVKSCHVVSISK